MFRVEVVKTEQDLQALRPEWRDLVRQCPHIPYFLTWEFTCLRWKYFAAGRKLWVMTARDTDGTLVGIAPFAIAQARVGPLRIRRLEFIYRVEIPFQYERFFLDGENLDIIAPPAYRDEVASAFFQRLNYDRVHWDIVDLAWLSPDSRLRAHFTETGTRMLEETALCAVATLPEDYASYEADILGKSETKRIKRFRRRLERDYPGQATFELITEPGEVVPAMDGLDRMKARRWDELGEVAPNSDDPHVQLHEKFDREFAEAALERDWLRFYQLRVNGEVIAAIHSIVFNGTDYMLNKGFDPAWKQLSPGNLLQAYDIEQSIIEGATEYDLGHGWLDAKRMWSNAEREDVRLIASTSWKGMTFYLREYAGTRVGKTARRLGRRLLSKQTRTRIRRAIMSRSRRMQGSATATDPDKQ